MAGRIIAQIIIQGASLFSRAFVSAYQQALQNAHKGGNAAAMARSTLKGMRADEALKVLNIEKSELNKAVLAKKYQKLFELNDPGKGGSFYLQSKIVRAKEALEKALEEPEGDAENRSGDQRGGADNNDNSSSSSSNSKPRK